MVNHKIDKTKNVYALVLGGYVNGYSVIRELYAEGVRNIALFDYTNSLSSKSNKITYHRNIKKCPESLRTEIFNLKHNAKFIVIFPTDDLQLELLYSIYGDISDFCFIPFNKDNIMDTMDKYVQYEFCEKGNIPYPTTIKINAVADIAKIKKLTFPVIVKPNTRKDLTSNVFRSLFLENSKILSKNKNAIENYIVNGISFLASEYVPGDDTNIFCYSAYRNNKGKILSEWSGKKLNQYPNLFGVFSSASNQAPDIVIEQGRKLLEIMDLRGITQPEFKYDHRDGKYKLMEINLRSTMWHRLAYLSGVKTIYTQYLDAIGLKGDSHKQDRFSKIHYIYMKHELLNLLNRKGYWKYFKYNVFGGDSHYFAVFDPKDLKPFLFDSVSTVKGMITIIYNHLRSTQ